MTSEYINESCNICGEDFTTIKDIYVDTEVDRYVCLNCARKYKLDINPCINDLEEIEDVEYYQEGNEV